MANSDNLNGIFNNPAEEHTRTIIHIDLDCFYAQVEILKQPELKTKPLGIQQKQIVVTANYVAREYGIKKCMAVFEAKQLCPQLILVNGEDLKDYRDMSTKVHNILQKFSSLVERLGLDENFVDVTEIVKERMKLGNFNIVGNVYGPPTSSNNDRMENDCYCGCKQRLAVGTQVAQEVRQTILTELGLTSCAGISYNKLLAKLATSTHKPNQQTVLFSEYVSEFLANLKSIRSIPGIGQKTYEILSSLGLKTVQDLTNYPVEKLYASLSKEIVNKLLNWCRGYDPTPVKASGKPQSIGLEDSFRNINGNNEVELKFKQLLSRLMELVAKDGRIPTAIRVTVRKFDVGRKTSHREQKQCNISPSLFSNNSCIFLPDESQTKLLAIIMKLFHKIIDFKKPFHVTLLGLSFTKFQQEKLNYTSGLASFFMKDVAVQAVTSLQNNLPPTNDSSTSSPMEIGTPRRYSLDINTDGSESEIEPSPKKTKFEKLIARRRCFNLSLDTPSPSKLRVAELRLNSREFDKSPSPMDHETTLTLQCPPDVDESVFNELPVDVQQEIVNDWKAKQTQSTTATVQTSTAIIPKNSILNYLVPNK